jgi:hypothetical protein
MASIDDYTVGRVQAEATEAFNAGRAAAASIARLEQQERDWQQQQQQQQQQQMNTPRPYDDGYSGSRPTPQPDYQGQAASQQRQQQIAGHRQAIATAVQKLSRLDQILTGQIEKDEGAKGGVRGQIGGVEVVGVQRGLEQAAANYDRLNNTRRGVLAEIKKMLASLSSRATSAGGSLDRIVSAPFTTTGKALGGLFGYSTSVSGYANGALYRDTLNTGSSAADYAPKTSTLYEKVAGFFGGDKTPAYTLATPSLGSDYGRAAGETTIESKIKGGYLKNYAAATYKGAPSANYDVFRVTEYAASAGRKAYSAIRGITGTIGYYFNKE